MVNNTLRSYLCGSPSSVGIRVSLIFPPPSNQWPCQFKTYGCSPSSVPTLLFFHFGGFLASPPCRRTSLQEQEFYAQNVAGASFTKKLAVEGWRLSPRAIPFHKLAVQVVPNTVCLFSFSFVSSVSKTLPSTYTDLCIINKLQTCKPKIVYTIV